MSRPKGSTQEPRRTIQIRVSLPEQAAFARRAAEVGLSMSEWMRMLARRDAGMWLGGDDQSYPDRDP